MTKHTSGKWTIRDAKYAKGIVSEMRFVVECDTNVPDVKGTVALVGYKPNARLIAAAPELLEACKALRKDIGADVGIGHVEKGFNCGRCLTKKAIAKAEGTQ